MDIGKNVGSSKGFGPRARLMWGPFPGRPEEEYRHQLGRYGISGELAMRPVASLSGGQKSRVAFAQMTMPW